RDIRRCVLLPQGAQMLRNTAVCQRAGMSLEAHLASGDALGQTGLNQVRRPLTRFWEGVLPERSDPFGWQLAARLVERDGDDAVRVHSRLRVLVERDRRAI